MGSEQSSLANDNIHPVNTGKTLSEGQGGRKSYATEATARMSQTSFLSGDLFFEHSATFEATQAVIIEDDDSVTEDSSVLEDDDSEDEYDDEAAEQEYQEALLERRRVLEDARNLKMFANFYSHPEKPVEIDGTATARCYFERPGAPERLSNEEAEEKAMIMEDLKALKQKAVDFMHPELPVVTSDACATARNYFSRASAPEQESAEDAAERAMVLEDAKALKKLAVDYMHPEMPVGTTTDPCACGRNYFSRASAPEQEDADLAAERAQILADAKALKQQAMDFMHPELPVVTDAFACGRNYFTRASAPEFEDAEEANERARILADAQQLKQLAVDYNHPELPVATDAFAFGRNYFSRPSAPTQEDVEEAEERARILQDAQQLKKLAVDYHHPEVPVVTTDAFAFGRNYFSRPSAPQMDEDEEEERARILADCAALKQTAVDFMHPEKPVETSDPFACGRNYFTRPSAPQMDEEEEEERARILADCAALKLKAVDFMHPEIPVVTTDPFACGRNYFTRNSAPMEDEDAEERTRILQECQALKQKAVDYMHPELPVVTTDPFACGRNFFGRFSAPEQEDLDDMEERERILDECMALKQKAVDYLHPELPVVTTDPLACSRNYYSRYSAPEQEDHDIDEERELVLEELKQLKKLAVAYKHPELPVETTDSFACGRNYFSRPSAPEQEDPEDAEERALVLADCQALKQNAVDYKHPELPVVTTDATAMGRNYFSRPSAPEQEDPEEAEERARVLADAKVLKEFAMHYKHPELPVVTTDATATGRNYFSRYTATGHTAMVHTFPAHEHDEHHEEHHEHVEHWGMDEDMMFDDMRHNMVVPTQGKVAAGGEEEEGNLSRSPSSVMLFTGESIYD